MHPPKTAKHICAFLGFVGYYRKFIKDVTKMAKPLTLLTHHRNKFEWAPGQHAPFLMLKNAVTQAPILHYPNPVKRYIVYTATSDDLQAHLQMFIKWKSPKL